MPRDLTTKYTPLGAGIFIARKGDAIHIITTDATATDLRCVDQNDGLGGSTPILSKSNWIMEQEVTPEQFGDVVASVFPEWKGRLVNVAPEGLEPFLLPQQLAPKHAQLVEAVV